MCPLQPGDSAHSPYVQLQDKQVAEAEAELQRKNSEIEDLKGTLRDLNFNSTIQNKVAKSAIKGDIMGGKVFIP